MIYFIGLMFAAVLGAVIGWMACSLCRMDEALEELEFKLMWPNADDDEDRVL